MTRNFRRRPQPLYFERLESRVYLHGGVAHAHEVPVGEFHDDALHGDVVVSVIDGRMLVIGDHHANSIRIEGTVNGHASVFGLNGTTINGGTSLFHSTQQLRSVGVQLDGGDDVLEIFGLVPRSSLVIEGNDGNDRIQVEHTHVSNFLANGGAGDDILEIDGLFAARSSWIMMESGNDLIAARSHAAGRHVSVSTGAGDDVVAINKLGTGRDFNLDAGIGHDQVLMSGETWVGRGSNIQLGTGNDFLGVLPGMTGSHAGISARGLVDAGAGNDMAAFDAAFTARRNVTVRGFESNGTGLQQSLDSLFERLADADIDPLPFGGPELQRELAVIPGSGTPAFTENGSGVSIDANLELEGPRGTTLVSATVTIQNQVAGQDELLFTNTASITGSFNSTTGVLTLTGNGSLTDWQAVLRTVRYRNSSEDPNTVTRQISIEINTGTETAAASRSIQVVSVPDAPVLTVTPGTRQIDIDDPLLSPPLVVDDAVILADLDTPTFNLSEVVVSIASGFQTGDVLGFAPMTGVTGSFDAATRALTFSGSLTRVELQSLLRSVSFDNSNARPPLGTRVIRFLAGDGATTSAQNVEVEVIASQSVMVDVSDSLLNFVESDPATVIDPALVITPGTTSGNNNVLSATVRFDGTYVQGQDVLEFTPVTGITGNFDSATGVLTFTGEASAADYQTLLRSVRYVNDARVPALTTGTREVEFTVSANGISVSDSRNILITAADEQTLIQNYLDENGLTSTRTASGLHFIVEQTGNGDFPTLSDSVVVNYTGYFLDGTEFDSGQNVSFPLTGVIEGWQEGIPQFSVGGSGQLLIPSDLAYGETGTGSIPPNSILRFEVELIAIVPNSQPILNVCIDGHDGLARHDHSTLRIFVDGVQQPIEANIGINDTVCTGLRGIHTHDTTGTLHIETPTQMDAPIGAFFQIWGQTFNSTQILGNVANASKEVVMFVNGTLNNQYQHYLMEDGDVIEIHYRNRTP